MLLHPLLVLPCALGWSTTLKDPEGVWMEVYGKGILKLQCMNSPLEFLEPISPEKHVGLNITSRGDVHAVVHC